MTLIFAETRYCIYINFIGRCLQSKDIPEDKFTKLHSLFLHLTVFTLEDPSDSSKLGHINNRHKPCHYLDSFSDVRVSSARSKPHLLYLP